MTTTTTRSTTSHEETEMTTTRAQRDTTSTHCQATNRKSRNTNGAGITMVGAAAGRHQGPARAPISGAGSSPGVAPHGA